MIRPQRTTTPARIACLLLVVFSCASCELKPPDPRFYGPTKPKHGPKEFWLNNGSEPEYIDPGLCSDSAGGDVIFNTFAALTESHPQTLEPIPDIARRWDISEDGRVYTFHLRPSKWSDGRTLTAKDFEWSWKRVLNPATGSKYASIVYPLANAEAYSLGALHLTGLPADTSDKEIETFFADAEVEGEIDRITRPFDVETLDASTTEAFLFLGGKHAESSALRAELAKELDQNVIKEQPITVRVCPHDVVGIEAIDDLTLRVTLTDPVPYFLSLVNHYTFMPVPRHVIEDLEKRGIPTAKWTRPEHHVCNGPFRIKEHRFRHYMLFEKNENYWNADMVQLDRVKALFVEKYSTCLNMYYTCDVDYPGGNTTLPAQLIDNLQTYEDFSNDPYLGVYFYWMNTQAPPLDNVNVRKALNLALDRESICKYITRSGQIPQSSVVPEGLGGYEGLKLPIFDPEAAREALAEAGYPEGKGLPEITLIYNTSEGHKQIAAAIQQMWKEHLGITVQIENQEWGVFLGRLSETDFQIARMGWIGDYVDPNTFMELLLSGSGNNHSNWKDRDFDEMLAEANRQSDPKKRLEMMREAESYMMEQYPMIPIYMYTRANLLKPYVRGIWGNFQDRHLWKYVSIDETWTGDDLNQPIPDNPLPEFPKVEEP